MHTHIYTTKTRHLGPHILVNHLVTTRLKLRILDFMTKFNIFEYGTHKSQLAKSLVEFSAFIM